jgi:hypothetical protein
VEAGEVPAQAAARQLGELHGHLHPGGAAADHDEGQPGRAGLVVIGHLSQPEGPENPRPHVEGVPDGLHPRRERGELVVPEIGLARPRGDGGAVVCGDRRGLLHP